MQIRCMVYGEWSFQKHTCTIQWKMGLFIPFYHSLSTIYVIHVRENKTIILFLMDSKSNFRFMFMIFMLMLTSNNIIMYSYYAALYPYTVHCTHAEIIQEFKSKSGTLYIIYYIMYNDTLRIDYSRFPIL